LIKIGQELDADILVLQLDSDGTQLKATTSVLDLRKNVLKARLEEKVPLIGFRMPVAGWRGRFSRSWI
jgi:hypothetical protein